MAKKCPPGTFCIQNFSLIGVLLLITVSVAIFVNMSTRMNHAKETVHSHQSHQSHTQRHSNPNYPSNYSNTIFDHPEITPIPPIPIRMPQNVLNDPRRPPLKDTSALYGYPNYPNSYIPSHGIPINQPTQAPYLSNSAHSTYQQIGILTRQQGEKILPLMGRISRTQSNKWQYYTMSDGNNSIRLPVSRNGKSCTSDNGCDEIMNGDTVYVEGYKDAFHATIYENDSPQYVPFIV